MDTTFVNQRPWALAAWSTTQLQRVESCLRSQVDGGAHPVLVEAMRYAVLDGGKRLRPLLTLAAHEAVTAGLDPVPAAFSQAALRAACAVELIHAYSLVHDDMPCMDNDVLRRGKPTVHVKFGEAQALLAGDALQALAFELLTPDASAVPPELQARLCQLLARAAGHLGMAGGQAIDLASVGQPLEPAQLSRMHALKTGALLKASVVMGAACGNASARVRECLSEFGEALGLAFQVVDDILDVTADSATLGKTAGKDQAQHKPTFVSVLGLDGARLHASQLRARALEALHGSGLGDVRALDALAHMVVDRKS